MSGLRIGPLRSILCLGAHSDDIEIGCGGTLLALAERHPAAHVEWVVLSAQGARAEEARASAADFLAGFASSRVTIKSFRDGFFPWQGSEIKEFFEQLKGEIAIEPSLILTHRAADRHQDHRLVRELTWNTFRRHLVLEYEIPKYEGDLGQPNFYVPLSELVWRRKIELLMQHFSSQRARDWFTPETFAGLARLRGLESRAPSGYAEAFHAAKIVLRDEV